MRKIVLIIFILTLFLLSGCTRVSKDDFKKDKSRYEEIKNEIIRFHVLANSDTP